MCCRPVPPPKAADRRGFTAFKALPRQPTFRAARQAAWVGLTAEETFGCLAEPGLTQPAMKEISTTFGSSVPPASNGHGSTEAALRRLPARPIPLAACRASMAPWELHRQRTCQEDALERFHGPTTPAISG